MIYRPVYRYTFVFLSAWIAIYCPSGANGQQEDISAEKELHKKYYPSTLAKKYEQNKLGWLQALLALQQRPKFPDNGNPGWVIDAYSPSKKSLIIAHETYWEAQPDSNSLNYQAISALRILHMKQIKGTTLAFSAKVGSRVLQHERANPHVEFNACAKYPFEIMGKKISFYGDGTFKAVYNKGVTPAEIGAALRVSHGASTLVARAYTENEYGNVIHKELGIRCALPFVPNISLYGTVGATAVTPEKEWKIEAQILASSHVMITCGYYAKGSTTHGPLVRLNID